MNNNGDDFYNINRDWILEIGCSFRSFLLTAEVQAPCDTKIRENEWLIDSVYYKMIKGLISFLGDQPFERLI